LRIQKWMTEGLDFEMAFAAVEALALGLASTVAALRSRRLAAIGCSGPWRTSVADWASMEWLGLLQVVMAYEHHRLFQDGCHCEVGRLVFADLDIRPGVS
jgi:hypothetical protein